MILKADNFNIPSPLRSCVVTSLHSVLKDETQHEVISTFSIYIYIYGGEAEKSEHLEC